jgi:ATP-dependent RNA helicase SUPV3L1/SUV3
MDGGLDALMRRVARNRTWAYVAHRKDWVTRAEGVRERVLHLDERLGTALHERLTLHFVEERASVRVERSTPHDVTLDGEVVVTRTVPLGWMRDFCFVPSPEANVLFGSSAVRRQGRRACLDVAAAQAAAAIGAPDPAFCLDDDLKVRWAGHAMARLVEGKSRDTPQVRLGSMDLLDEKLRRGVHERVRIWLVAERARCLGPLEGAVVGGAARGLLYLLVSGLGVVPRKDAAALVRKLTGADKAALKRLDVRLGVKWIYARKLLRPQFQPFRAAALAVSFGMSARPNLPGVAPAPAALWDSRYARALGYPCYGPRSIRVDVLERVAEALRRGVGSGGGPLPEEPMNWLGCTRDEWRAVAVALGYDVEDDGLAQRRSRRRKKKT